MSVDFRTFSLSSLEDGQSLTCSDKEGDRVVSFRKDAPPKFHDIILKEHFSRHKKILLPKYAYQYHEQHEADTDDPAFFEIFKEAFSDLDETHGYRWQVERDACSGMVS
jgi:hypothetical protein